MVDNTGIKYKNILISDAVFTSRATYHRTYPTTVGNNARNNTAPHPRSDNESVSVTNDNDRNGNNPRHPNNIAYTVNDNAEYRSSSFLPAIVYPAPTNAETITAKAAERYDTAKGSPKVPVNEIITTPESDNGTPTAIFRVIFSFKRMLEKMTVKIGIVAMIRLAAEAEMYCSP